LAHLAGLAPEHLSVTDEAATLSLAAGAPAAA
jgi:hypothetical protein